MVDILKITSSIPASNRVDHNTKQLPSDAVFDVNKQEAVSKYAIQPKNREEAGADAKGTLLQNLNKEIFEGLKADLTAQTDSFKKLVMFMKFFESPALSGSKASSLDIFMKPQDMLQALFENDKGSSVFQGQLFDALRVLAKAEGFPKLQDAIVNLLKHFDCFVNRDNSLNAIVEQSKRFASFVRPDDAKSIMDLVGKMEQMIRAGAPQKEMASFMKSDLLPMLSSVVDKYGGNEKLQNQVLTIVHNLMRYDKADGALLESSMQRLGAELKSFGKLTDDDIMDMRRMLFEHARDAKELANRGTISRLAQGNLQGSSLGNLYGSVKGSPYGNMQGSTQGNLQANVGDKEMLDVIAKALESSASSRINSAAQNMLVNLIQNESPVVSLLHFLLPVKFYDEETYAEVFVDKDAEDRSDGTGEALNIFFIIQSEKFGSFEVDLLAKGKSIDLDIRCPNVLQNDVERIQSKLNEMIEEQGFKLSNYKVAQYDEDRTILQRFPKLAMRKAGIDVRI